MKVFNSNVLSAMHGFRDNEVSLQPSVLRQRALHALVYDGFWKNNHDFMIVFHFNCFSGMHGFRDIDGLSHAGYDVIVIYPPSWASRDFQDGFWKKSQDFMKVIDSTFLAAMYGFRDNEVLLPNGYDGIVISPPGGASRDYSWRILKERS